MAKVPQGLKDFFAEMLAVLLGSLLAVGTLTLALAWLVQEHVRLHSLEIILPPTETLPAAYNPAPGTMIRIDGRPKFAGIVECEFDRWIDESQRKALLRSCHVIPE